MRTVHLRHTTAAVRALLVLVCVFAAGHTAKAQQRIAVYASGGYGESGYSLDGGHSFFHSDKVGLLVGGTYDFLVEGRLRLGADARLTELPGSYGATAGGAALRVAFVPAVVPLRPYFQIGGQYISTRLPASSSLVGAQSFNSGGLALAFGLDVRLAEHFDLRAIDLGVEAGDRSGIASATSGLVYRF